jgi:hypothetical protein
VEEAMTVEVVTYTRDELLKQRGEILRKIPDLDELRSRAERHAETPDERDLLIDLREVDFLLGDDG